MDPNTTYQNIDLFLGGIFVLFYAANRFNTPATNRSSTTAGRYFVGLFFYCLVGIGFYLLLVNFPHLLAFVLAGNSDAVPVWAQKISFPLLVALLLTVLLPKVPFLSTVDAWVCRQLQNMAAIPWEVLRLSAELRKDILQISNDEQVAIQEYLEDEGFDQKGILFETTSSPASAWTQLTALLHKVEDWKSDRRMAGYVAASAGELDKLQRRHQSLFSKAKTCFNLLNEDEVEQATGKTHEAVVRYREDFMERVAQLRNDTLDFIARGVLRAELTESARESRLKALGFSIDWPDPPFTINQIMLLFGVLCVITLSGFVVFADTVRGVPFGLMLTRAVMISVIYSVAVACAVVPKARWKLARRDADDVRPIAFYLVAGLMAVGISQFIGLLFNVVLTGGLGCGWQRSLINYPWLLVSFGTALMTGVLSDNPRLAVISRWQQRCLEGLAQGTAMFGVAYLTYYWLQERVSVVTATCNLKYQVPPRLTMMVMAGVVGFVIGFFIPTWYRRHQEVSEKERAQKVPLKSSAMTQPRPTTISV